MGSRLPRHARLLRAFAVVILVVATAILALRLLFPLPPLGERAESAAVPASEATALGRAWLPHMAEHPGLSGVRPLPSGLEAFSARVMLAREAQAAIDAQYYVWQDDGTGRLLLDEMRMAAERGVRVRLLLDDNGIAGLDEELWALDELPSAEVRLWNPFTIRSPKALDYLFDFPRANRRMHNKSLTVDGIVTVVGGRNVGDVYYAYGPGTHYMDFEMLAVGPAAEAVGADFDRYWAAASAFPAALILPEAPGGLDELREGGRAAAQAPETAAYGEAVAGTPLMRDVAAGQALIEWVPVTVLSDDPAKGLGDAGEGGLLLTRLLAEVGEPTESLDIVSAYFVPGPSGAQALADLGEAGVAVRVLTNAWEATDVPLVHAGYLRARPFLLDSGVELLELRATVALEGPAEGGARLASLNPIGASASSLHAKTMVWDRTRVFVGSFDFDQRSARLNTAMGVLVESPGLAAMSSRMMDEVAPVDAYRLERDTDGAPARVGTDAEGREVRLAPEPGTTALTRAALWAVGLLPIEWMLRDGLGLWPVIDIRFMPLRARPADAPWP